MDQISVPTGYYCPLCPGHQDEEDDFYWSNLLSAPICHGCVFEIDYLLVNYENQPTPEEINIADLVEKIEKITGLSYQVQRYLYLRDQIEEKTGAAPHFSQTSPHDLTDAELRLANHRLKKEWNRIEAAGGSGTVIIEVE